MKHAILIVDDDILILNTLKKRFDNWDMEVYAVKNAMEAKEAMAKIVPDIVLLDLLLTTEDGSVSILDYMKGRPDLENVPVVVLTNLDKPELRHMMAEQGVKEYLIKGSLSLDDIYNKVLSYVEPQKAN